MRSNTIIDFCSPAENWNEALPTGNGRLGGMVFGRPYVEYVQLNEDSVWSGSFTDRNNPSAYENLAEIRRLIFAGKIIEAQELCAFALSGTPETQRHYEPLGNLYLLFAGDKNPIEKYSRKLDLTTGVITTSFLTRGVTYKREIFTSYPHNVMVLRLTSDKSASLSFHTQIVRGNPTWDYEPYQTRTYRNPNYSEFTDKSYTKPPDISVMTGSCNGGGKLCAAIKVISEGGIVKAIGNSLIVREADSVTILLSADTTYRENDPEASAIKRLEIAAKLGYERLCEAHLSDYRSLYNRVELDVGDIETERLFNFGRYLLISSSRPGSLPANLQGLWNTDFAPAWGSKYTININTQMNYWHAETCNLSECHLPLFEHIKRMVKNGRQTAKYMYGCNGFMAHHNTDIWGDTAPQDVCLSSSYWVLGAAWLCLHIWEHYLFSLDKNFLREHYPLMREAAEFVVNYLTDDGEFLVTCPTLSPENEYRLPNGETGVICKGASMDNQIIRELFNACIASTEILNTDAEFARILSDTLKRVAGIMVGKHGQIMEWNEDYDEIDIGHRHISQLFALHPGTQIDSAKNPELAAAARVTLERRLSGGGGHTGWSRAWIINMWARLGDGDNALTNAKELLRNATLPNLFSNHPPFQIDGNFGFTAGIAEMLLQSRVGEIVLLPALPKEWSSGSVRGLMARGGFEVDMRWENHKLTGLDILSKSGGECVIKTNEQTIEIVNKPQTHVPNHKRSRVNLL